MLISQSMNKIFYNQDANSDKVYLLDVTPCPDNPSLYEVVAKWGARGGTLKQEIKDTKLTLRQAQSLTWDLMQEKLKKGYKQVSSLQEIPQKVKLPKNKSIKKPYYSFVSQDDERTYVLMCDAMKINLSGVVGNPMYGFVLSESSSTDDGLEFYDIYGAAGLFTCTEAEMQQLISSGLAYLKNKISTGSYNIEDGSEMFLVWKLPNKTNEYLYVVSCGPDELLYSWVLNNTLIQNNTHFSCDNGQMEMPASWGLEAQDFFFSEFSLDTDNSEHIDFWEKFKTLDRDNLAKIAQQSTSVTDSNSAVTSSTAGIKM